MRRLNPDDASAGSAVEAAEGTLPVPGFDDDGRPRAAAPSLCRAFVTDERTPVQQIRVQADCHKDIGCHGSREVALDQPPCCLVEKLRTVPQGRLQSCLQSPGHALT
jgi:hypothetical protein